MPRPRTFDAAQERWIGRFCIRARRRGVSWKRLQRRFGLGRTKLHQLVKDVREHISDGQRRPAADYGRIERPADDANVVRLAQR
jgi:hypothetical protein